MITPDQGTADEFSGRLGAEGVSSQASVRGPSAVMNLKAEDGRQEAPTEETGEPAAVAPMALMVKRSQ
jgi:hypothetical protein